MESLLPQAVAGKIRDGKIVLTIKNIYPDNFLEYRTFSLEWKALTIFPQGFKPQRKGAWI